MTLRGRLFLLVAVTYATGLAVLTPTLLDSLVLGLVTGWLWGGVADDVKRLEGR